MCIAARVAACIGIGDDAAKGGDRRFDRSVSWRASPAFRPWSESLESGHPVGTTRG